jgi:hypothetical protein
MHVRLVLLVGRSIIMTERLLIELWRFTQRPRCESAWVLL